MKKLIKIFIPVLTLLLVISAPVMRVYAGEITTLNAVSFDDGTNTGVLIDGTAGAGVLAVSICIYESDGSTLINLYTTAVDASSKFSYAYALAPGDYVVKVADYDGGTFATKNVTVVDESAPIDPPTPPAPEPTPEPEEPANATPAPVAEEPRKSPKTGAYDEYGVMTLAVMAVLGVSFVSGCLLVRKHK